MTDQWQTFYAKINTTNVPPSKIGHVKLIKRLTTEGDIRWVTQSVRLPIFYKHINGTIGRHNKDFVRRVTRDQQIAISIKSDAVGHNFMKSHKYLTLACRTILFDLNTFN